MTARCGRGSCMGSPRFEMGIGAPDFRLFGAILVDVSK
jgi:hypothetical protein